MLLSLKDDGRVSQQTSRIAGIAESKVLSVTVARLFPLIAALRLVAADCNRTRDVLGRVALRAEAPAGGSGRHTEDRWQKDGVEGDMRCPTQMPSKHGAVEGGGFLSEEQLEQVKGFGESFFVMSRRPNLQTRISVELHLEMVPDGSESILVIAATTKSLSTRLAFRKECHCY